MNAQGFHSLRIYRKLAETACKEGFVAFLFDFRGVGKSQGNFDYGFGEQQDVKCALNFLASKTEVLSDKIFVAGHSLGGAVSLYAVRDDARIKGLALWSTPKNHNYNVKKFIARTRGKTGLCLFLILSYVDRIVNVSRLYKLQVFGVNLRLRYVREKLMKLDECKAVSRLKFPVLIVAGDKDNLVDVDEAQAIYDAANEPKELFTIESANHIYARKEKEVITKTVEWLKRNLNKF
jgi:alpha/beta superfamily hydrolase